MFVCNVCTKEFTFATNLRRHRRNVHATAAISDVPSRVEDISPAMNEQMNNGTVQPSETAETGHEPNCVEPSTNDPIDQTSSYAAESVTQRSRFNELVDDDTVFEHGCEVLECEHCEMYFTTQEQLERHEVL